MDAQAFEIYLAMQARNTRYRRAQGAQRIAERERQALEDAQFFDAIQARLEVDLPCDSERIWRVVLPSGPEQSAPLPRERRRRYLEHLVSIIHAARQQPAEGLADTTVTETTATSGHDGAITGHLCAVCRGGCCREGAEHGYLEPDSIQRFMAQHPGCTVRQVLRAYLRHVPKVSMIGGCVNQTEVGCSLPRTLRSTGCNQFVCAPMAAAQQRERVDPPLQVMLVLQRRLDHWQQQRSLTDNPVVGAARVGPRGFVRLDGPA